VLGEVRAVREIIRVQIQVEVEVCVDEGGVGAWWVWMWMWMFRNEAADYRRTQSFGWDTSKIPVKGEDEP
jgi:hypothetical protein